MTEIIRCDCDHNYQNAAHGDRMRVCNLTKIGKTADMLVWRCTVCGKTHTKGRAK